MRQYSITNEQVTAVSNLDSAGNLWGEQVEHA